MDHPLLPGNPIAAIMTVVGLVISYYYWSKNKNITDDHLPLGLAAVAGGLLGAKLGFVIGEAPIWWNDEMFWLRMLYGKTILGGLLGGWLGVETIKRVLGVRRPTGDDFARVIPLGISAGRIGCLVHGCCQGKLLTAVFGQSTGEWLGRFSITHWPAPFIEIAFQFAFLLFSYTTRHVKFLRNQHFHLYMILYGLFRFVHEFARNTPRYSNSGLSPYMVLAAVCCVAGCVGFLIRDSSSRQV